MVVIADTSPLNYLILIGQADLLRQLYGQIVIPRAVLRELQHPKTPASVARWMACRPPWLVVNEAPPVQQDFDPATLSEELDAGEREAILLAIEQQPDALLLVDDNVGRREAARHRIAITGTLGILNAAAAMSLVKLRPALEALLATNFHVSQRILRHLLDVDAP
jgi:predicted nucleic acid-binding protein